jgi:hypothetical protein
MVVHAYNSALRRQRQEELEFQANLGSIVRPCLKKTKTKANQTKTQINTIPTYKAVNTLHNELCISVLLSREIDALILKILQK